STLYARVWPAAGTEPATWMVTVTDTSFASGYSGLRLLDQGGAVVTYTAFTATSNPILAGALTALPAGTFSGMLVILGALLLAPMIARRIRRRAPPGRT
ncbi:MAG TPA: hypothetical protein VEW68_06860, partial [Patescibacteria group bacterium]|nr:hypothetical protein [Patescibacteria group bacterium]